MESVSRTINTAKSSRVVNLKAKRKNFKTYAKWRFMTCSTNKSWTFFAKNAYLNGCILKQEVIVLHSYILGLTSWIWTNPSTEKTKIWKPFKMKCIWGLQSWTLTATFRQAKESAMQKLGWKKTDLGLRSPLPRSTRGRRVESSNGHPYTPNSVISRSRQPKCTWYWGGK